MQAIILQSPNTLALENAPDPVISEYDALCEVQASAICAGTDRHIIQNNPYFQVEFPTIIGHEGIGKVIKLGAKVKYIKMGDTVTRVLNQLPENSSYKLKWGAMAQKGIVRDWQAMRDDGINKQTWRKHTINQVLPRHYDAIESTMIITWRETYAFLKKINPNQNDKILIIGSGANALSFANHLKNLGFSSSVIGSPKRKEQFLKIGVNQYISYKDKSELNLFLKANNEKINIIIDTICQCDYLTDFLPMLAKNAKIGAYGLDSFFEYEKLIKKTAKDFLYYSGADYDEGSAHPDIIYYIDSHKLNAWDYLSHDHVYELKDFKRAFQAAISGVALKPVIKFT